MISQKILDKFKNLYYLDYQITLSDSEALEKCTALFTMLNTVIDPLTMSQNQTTNEDR